MCYVESMALDHTLYFANLLLLSPEEQVGDFCEVFLHNDTQTLCSNCCV